MTITHILQHTIDQLKAVLLFAGGWMEDMGDTESDNPDHMARQEQLVRLRQLCIPEITTLLHKVLQETNRKDELRQLVDIINSEDTQLYKVIMMRRGDREGIIFSSHTWVYCV